MLVCLSVYVSICLLLCLSVPPLQLFFFTFFTFFPSSLTLSPFSINHSPAVSLLLFFFSRFPTWPLFFFFLFLPRLHQNGFWLLRIQMTFELDEKKTLIDVSFYRMLIVMDGISGKFPQSWSRPKRLFPTALGRLFFCFVFFSSEVFCKDSH